MHTLGTPVNNMRFSEQLVSLDHAMVLERLGGDEELLQEVAQLFLEEYPTLMSEMCSAAQGGDAHRLERAAHSLKGSIANFGVEPAVQAALNVENIGRSGDLTNAVNAYEQLAALMRQLHPSFEQLAAA
jgi:two-component system sensor histidine kinase/response regulator